MRDSSDPLYLIGIVDPIDSVHVCAAYDGSPSSATSGKVRNTMKRSKVAVLFASLVFTAAASASGPVVPWTTKDMKTAIRAIGYPKPHPKKLGCTGSGATTSGTFTSFRCVATYRHHRHRRFWIEGEGEGGWLCAGKTIATCQLLRHGFLTSQAVAIQGMAPSVDLAARGYMTNKYGSYQARGFCKQTTSSTWMCPFVEATVTLTVKAAKGGYVVAGSVS